MRSRALNLAALALLVSVCGWSSAGVRPAAAQALDAGKPPAQIFSGTCSACHRSPRGLVRSVSPGSLPGFLRQHYTTGNEMAGTMAAYVLSNGGTDRVAEPPPKREPKQEPKQRAKSDSPEVAARTPEQAKDQSKSAKQQKAGKKGPEPAPAAPVVEPEKAEPAVDTAKADTAATDCKVEEPLKQAAAPGAEAVATAASTPPRQPTSLLTLPGFPAPEPEPAPVVAATQPGCDPAVTTTTAAAKREEPPKEAPKEPPREASRDQPAMAAAVPAAAPATVAEAPKTEPLRPTVAEAAPPPPLDIMQEEVHGPRPAARAPQPQQKKRTP